MRVVLPVTSMLLTLIGRVGAVTFAVGAGKRIDDESWQTETLGIPSYRGAGSGIPITRIRIQFAHIFTFRRSKHKTAV